MVRVEKTYGFIMPINHRHYSKGNKYVTLGKVKEDREKGDTVILESKSPDNHEIYGQVEKTVRLLHLHSKMPTVVRKILPEAAFVMREVSYSNPTHTHTKYINTYYDTDVFKMEVLSLNIDLESKTNKPFSQHTSSEVEYIMVGDCVGDCMVSYKHIIIEVNGYFIGWIAYELNKRLKSIIHSHQTSILESYKEWSLLNDEDIRKLEDEVYGSQNTN